MFSIDSEMKYLHVFPFGKTFDKSWERKYFNVLLQGHCMRMKSLDEISRHRTFSRRRWMYGFLGVMNKAQGLVWRMTYLNIYHRYILPLTLRWVIIAVQTLEVWVHATKCISNVNEDDFRDAPVTLTSLSITHHLWLVFRLQYGRPQIVAILYSGSPVFAT